MSRTQTPPSALGSCLIVGAGPGIGQSVAEAFAQEGYDLALLARQPQRLAGLCGELSKKSGRRIFSYAADAAAQESLLQGVAAARADLGDPEVLVYNVAQHAPGRPMNVPLDELIANFRTNVVGALIAARAVAPAMIARGRGSILFTGGGFATAPAADYSSLSMDKAALRSLTFTLAQELGAHGVHVATVTVHGFVQTGTQYDPQRIARAFVQLHHQPKGHFETEVVCK
ncbi:MAG: SDR family NAD(P)-dependent oxidoreductase [Sinimarinibacterium flocculans]|uniref:Short-subunit dehydrogenase n=1 Tax=Sinimarinibacterium flocculans TaxID=985250 RepID=A0A318EAD3_9GAMM|nr:SDR family NAD(P)-dependent oxidoreductase [Sinimarinibacterium flocculans]MEC9363801.1 SDR family NAD(P)-dependent oxidoreductase [Pseudomonadota bacterium]PXV67770.1 short-subunit dehydrogenase [Sinimarinibacterium flocculans]